MALYFVVNDADGQIATIYDWDGESDVSVFVNQTFYPYEEGPEPGWFRQSDGTYIDPAFQERKHQRKREIEAHMQDVFRLGYSPSTGPLAGHTLQCRDTEDRTNWLTSQTSYMAAVQMGYGAVAGASFRTMANQTVTVTFQEGLDILTNGMAVWGKNIMARSWALKDEVEAAASFEVLEAIDIYAGWTE